MRKLLLIGIIASMTSVAVAQGFPYEIFKPRTLKEVWSSTVKQVRPDDTMFFALDLEESKMEVTFTGKSRPMIKTRKDFLTMWAQTFDHPMSYVTQYENEYLYKEGDDEYWMATEAPVTKYFDKELKPGDKMELYLISIGAFRIDKTIDCVLLVEEYKK